MLQVAVDHHLTPQKKFGNLSLTDDFSVVTNSFSLHLVSLESPVIPLYNDVPFVEYGGGCKVKCAKMHCYCHTL